MRNLNQASAVNIQSKLIAWWNEQYGQKTTNLGQINHQLADGSMKQAITDLQSQLYAGNAKTINIDWNKLVNKHDFKPAKQDSQVLSGLPKLYS